MKPASFICLFSVVSLLAGDQPAAVTVTKETAFTFHRGFKRLTKEPHRVSVALSVLCTNVTFSPSSHTSQAVGIHVYVNPLANETITQKRKVFPTGAVIVKEKLDVEGVTIGVGGMIKRAAGFDKMNGDWEYFYSDKDAGFSMGRLQKCADCHGNVKGTDYVFSVWKPFD
jgi:hypothetical protein